MDLLFTGGYEDLVHLILRREQRILETENHELPYKPRWKRLLLEFPLNFAAASYATLLKVLPPRVSERFFLSMFDILTGYKYQSVGISISNSSFNAVNIYSFIKKEYSEPALLTLSSHPPVIGEIRDLNLGLMGAGFRLMRRVHGASRPFRIMLAVDVMALDTLSVAEEAIYAGAMGTYHVATDRLPSARNPLQKLVLGRASYPTAAWRLLDALRRRHNVVMIQAGGVAETARLIYTAREFIWRLRQESGKKPWEVTGALKTADKRFATYLLHFRPGGNHWKRLETYLVATLARDPLVGEFSRETPPPSNSGDLEGLDKHVLAGLFEAFGLPEARRRELEISFAEEFKRITPYRERMFRQLLRRVIRRGIPVVILSMDYSLDPKEPILQREPIALVPGPGKTCDAIVSKDGALHKVEGIGDAFFVSWSRSTFTS